jgi:photosystem II stability/assembly factor-like uncharacterized protein
MEECMRTCFAAVLVLGLSAAQTLAGGPRNFDDAPLHAVQFVDEREGWAVGDDGVIWHTIDSGATWERQPSGVRTSLRSLHFLNPYTGWIAGREELSNQGSLGVLLFTRDGGLHWDRVGTNASPGFNHIQFVDAKTGFAVGDGNEQNPTGVFRTTDGGATWRPTAGPRYPSWLTADFQDGQTGTLAGAWSRLSVMRQGAVTKADMEDTLGPRAIRGLQVVGKRAIAVGQGGLILVSRDSAGARWSYADLKLPPEVRAAWDFHAVHCVAENAWVVGRPGSAVLHSPDLGRTWEVQATGQPLPLNGVHFHDILHGWAVGELGSILATVDGGKSWHVQHRGGQRSAILFVHARPGSLPLDTVAIVGGDDGYLAAGIRVLTPDPASDTPSQASAPQRLAGAMRTAGGAAGEVLWQFPVPQHLARAAKQELVKSWNSALGDQAAEELVRQLVLALRIWRPSVVVTDNPDERFSGWPADALIAEALHEAISRAADATAYPEQIRTLGLAPWDVAKLYAVWSDNSGAQVALDLTEPRPNLDTTPSDFAGPASALVGDAPLPAVRYFHLLESKLAGASKHRDLMTGVDLAPGGAARRKQDALATLSPETEKAIRTRRYLETVAESPAGGVTDPGRLLAQVGKMLGNMTEHHAARAASQIAQSYVRLGQWELAREIYLMLVDRYPTDPLAIDALRWLIRHNASSEARRRQEMGHFWIATQTNVEGENQTIQRTGMTLKGNASTRTVGRMAILADQEETRRWYQGCLQMEPRLTAFGPLYGADPTMQFCLQSARRQLGQFDPANKWYAQFAAEHEDGPWRAAAAAEVWLTSRNGLPAKPLANCRQTDSRPYLDGQFNDDCWKDVAAIKLVNASGNTAADSPTEVRLAYDKEFIYVALRCAHPAQTQLPPVRVRGRDADLRPYDRVSFLIDLDRDYATYYQLQVDRRGCVCDDCWGDQSWNPHWFVALHTTPTYWQIEAAIPVQELTGSPITIGRTWAFNVVRTIPGRGVQAWSLPAGVDPRPEGMGLLAFTARPK